MDYSNAALADRAYVRSNGSSAQRIVLIVVDAAVKGAEDQPSDKEMIRRYFAMLKVVQAEIEINRPESPPDRTH